MIKAYKLCKITKKKKAGGSFFHPKYERNEKFKYIKVYISKGGPIFIYEDEDGRDWFDDFIKRRIERAEEDELSYYERNGIDPDFPGLYLSDAERQEWCRKRRKAGHEFFDADEGKRIKGNIEVILEQLSFKAPRLKDEESDDGSDNSYIYIDKESFINNFELNISNLDTKEIKDMMSNIKAERLYVSSDLASRKETRAIWNKVYDMLENENRNRIKSAEEKECARKAAEEKRALRRAEIIRKRESLEAKSGRENDRETNADKSNYDIGIYGEKGEENVDYVIKWLGKEYKSIEKNCPSRFKKDKLCIRLKNKELIDEEQEFDHIIVFSSGVFMIETKFYKGKIKINENRLWTRITDNKEEGIENPEFQVSRHHKVLASILDGLVEDKDIYDIICIAHNTAIIEGAENSSVPIVKYDVLENKIRTIASTGKSKYDTDEIVDRINRFKIFDYSNSEIANKYEK